MCAYPGFFENALINRVKRRFTIRNNQVARLDVARREALRLRVTDDLLLLGAETDGFGCPESS